MLQDADICSFLKKCHLSEDRLADNVTLAQLYADLCNVNEQVNLTRLTSEEEYWLRHVVDSLALGAFMPEVLASSLRVADVGCGGGFPLLVLAWANPELMLTGIELKQKKVDFIAKEVARLGLSNCSVVARQVKEVSRLAEHREQYDLVVLRAVGTAGDYLKQCRLLLKPVESASLVFYKTPDAVEKESELAIREAGKYGLGMTVSEVIELPRGAGQRQFMSFRKR